MNHYHSRQVSVKVNQELLKSADALAYAPYIETILRHTGTQRLPTLYVDAECYRVAVLVCEYGLTYVFACDSQDTVKLHQTIVLVRQKVFVYGEGNALPLSTNLKSITSFVLEEHPRNQPATFKAADNSEECAAFVSAAILELNERFKVALSKLPTLDSGVVPPVHALNEGWPLLFLSQCDGYCEQHRVSSSTLTRTLTTIQHMEITPPEDSWVAPCVALPTNMVLISGVPVHKQLGDVYVVCDNGKLTVRYWELYSKGKHRLSEPCVVARRNSELVARDYTEEELEMFLDYIEYVGKLPNQVYSKHSSARHLQAMLEWAFCTRITDMTTDEVNYLRTNNMILTGVTLTDIPLEFASESYLLSNNRIERA